MKKKQADSKGMHGAQTPLRVAPRLKAEVKSRGTRPKKKPKTRGA